MYLVFANTARRTHDKHIQGRVRILSDRVKVAYLPLGQMHIARVASKSYNRTQDVPGDHNRTPVFKRIY